MYEVQAGETYSDIAEKVYGLSSKAGLLIAANPSVPVPIKDKVITVPDDPEAFVPLSLSPSTNPDEVILRINGERFHYWREMELTQALDTISQVTFSAPFRPTEKDFRENFKPFTYSFVDVIVGNNVVFQGRMMNVAPAISSSENIVVVNAYAKAGFLNDCTYSASQLPLEFANRTLEQIAVTLASPFGVPVVFSDPPGDPFDKVSIKVGENILPFLIKLAGQRGLVVRSDRAGRLEFHVPKGSILPVANLVCGESPLTAIGPTFEPQGYYSDLTGIKPAKSNDKGGKYTVNNKRLQNTFRPHTFEVKDVGSGGIKGAVLSKMGRMFGSMCSYSLELSTWRDPLGSLFEPDTFVNVDAPQVMIYDSYKFLIRTVKFKATKESRTAILEIVLPGSFSNEIPEALPWD